MSTEENKKLYGRVSEEEDIRKVYSKPRFLLFGAITKRGDGWALVHSPHEPKLVGTSMVDPMGRVVNGVIEEQPWKLLVCFPKISVVSTKIEEGVVQAMELESSIEWECDKRRKRPVIRWWLKHIWKPEEMKEMLNNL